MQIEHKNNPSLEEVRGYLKIKSDMVTRREYIEKAIQQVSTAPPASSDDQDQILVSREAMEFVLTRALDGVDAAIVLNETIQKHNTDYDNKF